VTPLAGASTSLFVAAADVMMDESDKYQSSCLASGGLLSQASKLTLDTVKGREMWALTEDVAARLTRRDSDEK
jgi:hypothetical protein